MMSEPTYNELWNDLFEIFLNMLFVDGRPSHFLSSPHKNNNIVFRMMDREPLFIGYSMDSGCQSWSS